MKTRTLIAEAFLCLVLNLVNSGFAQGTAFTYQGRLNAGANPANGSYDLMFTLFGTSSGGSAVSGPITNAPTPVSNGLFTVTLDFGNQFPGADRWLEIGVRTNGAGAFATLGPRQPVTASPYAVRAGSVAAGNITGTLGLAQLPTAVITNGASGVNIAGSFTGNGGGLTNVPGAIPIQIVSGTSVLAQANKAYDATNAGLVIATLPTNANVGDVVQVNGLGSGGWQVTATNGQIISSFDAGLSWRALSGAPVLPYYSLACSSNGLKLVSGTFNSTVYTSVDGGLNWANQPGAPFQDWKTGQALASSADGSKLVAAPMESQIYTSTNGGVNWTARASFRQWQSVASSYDGTKLVAVNIGEFDLSEGPYGRIYTSTDSGANWIPGPVSNYWSSVASSADGIKLVATTRGDFIYTSTDGGFSWTPRASSGQWQCVASSADGTKLVAAQQGGQIYTSTDSGASWTARPYTAQWQSVACSADGTRIIVAAGGGSAGPIYASFDSGASWKQADAPLARWECVRASADGTRFFATYDGNAFTGGIYISAGTPLAGGPGTSVTLQYAGNGVWQALNVPTSSNLPNSLVLRDAAGSITVGAITAGPISIFGKNTLEFGAGVAGKEFNAGKLGYQAFTPDALDIVGAGTSGGNRKIKFWSEGGASFAGTVSAPNFAGNGSGLTSLNATQLTTGVLPDARLSSNVALRSVGNTFTGDQVVSSGRVGVGAISPQRLLQVGDSSVAGSEGMIHMASRSAAGSAARDWIIGVPQTTNDTSGVGYSFIVHDIGLAMPAQLMVQWGTGNVGIGNTNPANLLVVGNAISPAYCNGTTWVNGSDRNAKENFAAVDPVSILERVVSLPVQRWNYKAQPADEHIGPVAQDFHAAFGLNGQDETHIATVDESGVALAAIQGLNQKVENGKQKAVNLEQRLQQKETEITELKSRLEKLERLMNNKQNGGDK